METDPDALLESVWELIDSALLQAGDASQEIVGVCTCTFAGNTLGIDASGRAVTPLIPYADTRAARDAQALRERLDEDACHQRTGTAFHPGYLPARLIWFAREMPDAFRKVDRWITFGEYMALHLFGETAVSTSIASWSGLEDIHQLAWDAELLAALPISPENLSPLVDASMPWQGLRPIYASRWPALRGASWFPAIGDGAASNLGSGCISPDQVAVMIGTSTAVRRVIFEIPQIPQGLWCYRVDRRRALLGGAMSEGGNLYAWLSNLLNWTGTPDLEAAAAGVLPDGHGLTFLPLVAGERSPGWAGDARGAIAGLSLATTPADILRAGMEGVAYRIQLISDLLQGALPGNPEIIASGGALLASATWRQILADVLGRPVIQSRSREASARGAALLALEALGLVEDAGQLEKKYGEASVPDAGRHKIYQAAISAAGKPLSRGDQAGLRLTVKIADSRTPGAFRDAFL